MVIRDERGGSTSLMAAMLAPAIIVAVGLVVDGGGKLATVREAQAVADEAARSGADASAAAEIHSGRPSGLAMAAAQAYLTDAGVEGTVTLVEGEVVVHTTMTYKTQLISIIGINELPAEGNASARVLPS